MVFLAFKIDFVFVYPQTESNIYIDLQAVL